MDTKDPTVATPRLLDDPLAFARQLYEDVTNDDPRLATHAPKTFVAYNEVLDRLKQLHPEDVGFRQPLSELDEAALAWGGEAFTEGVKFALEADRLRRALLAMAMAAEANAGM